METTPASTRLQIAKRRSSRICLNTPVGLSGEDCQKCSFNMPAKASNLNRYGAAIHLPRQLLVGSVVTVRNTRGTEIPARVVAQLASSQGVSVYGIEFIEQGKAENNFWGISFPPLHGRVSSAVAAEQVGIARRKRGVTALHC